MKKCSWCGKFVARKGLCPPCKQKYNRAWYKKNKQVQLKRAKRNNALYKKETSEYVNRIKDVPCSDCGGRFPPCAMDFDHLGRKPKSDNISRMVRTGRTLSIIKREIEKCEVVCSNCHRVRTQKRLCRSTG